MLLPYCEDRKSSAILVGYVKSGHQFAVVPRDMFKALQLFVVVIDFQDTV